jgi:hypothetical protein
MKLDKKTKDRLWRVVLRIVPGLPGPEIYDLLLHIRKSQTDFDQQVTEAVESLQKTSTLITTLENGVKERMQKLQHLRKEHDRYSELAQIEAKKAEALLSQVEATLGKGAAKERWIALAMHLGVGFVFFVVGVLLSDSFKAWIEHIWRKVTQ